MRHNAETTDNTNSFAVVAVGASAGGLEAFTQLLHSLPNNTGMAFVFIQHLDPTHHSMLSELLSKAATMPVVESSNGTIVQPNHVYVIPPNVNMGILQRRLQLTPRVQEPGLHTPIDFFMRSLAKARNSRSIGVVLSGTASDGTRGLAAIKAEGGITFAQDERSAKYPGMPHSAIASGCVDFILPPEKIGRELARISGHPYLVPGRTRAKESVKKTDAGEANFKRMFALLRKACGINFGEYKSGTIQRRVLRRMAIHKIEALNPYVQYLEKHPQELEQLCQDLLIPVTSFFRDPEAFEALKTKVFPAILKDKTNKGTIRIWAPGCSTGEETYSLAITLLEYLGDKASSFQIQLFGTDVNERGIEKARAGVYSAERLAQEVSPDRLRRFFTKIEEGYQVSKSVRDLCVFAKQTLTEDPPFSQMNLVVCRNLLIYLGPDLQRKIVPILHYALRPSGFLMLGNSESVTAFPDLFASADKKHKTFIKKPVASRLHYDFSTNRYPREALTGNANEQGANSTGLDRQHEADLVILKSYAPPGVVISEGMEILQFRGAIAPYIDPAPGRASLNLLKIARKEFVAELRAAVDQAKKNGAPVKRKSVEFRREGQLKAVNISVEPLGASIDDRQYLILFERTSPSVSVATKSVGKLRGVGRTAKEEIAQLRRKLATTEEHLRSVIESKEASDEEYQSANEEILSGNEELQSTNEELETSKEELQSTNEELNTVNDELHNRNIDLDRTNSDLHNVLASTSLPVVMVDRGLRVRRLTSASAKILKILPSDIGRVITDIRSDLDVPNLDQLISSVIDTLTPKELEVQDKEGHWYSLQIRPYRTLDDKIDGAVVVLLDIDVAKQASELLKKSEEFMAEILDTVREPLIVLDEDLTILYVNPSFLKEFRVSSEETVGNYLYLLGNGQWDIRKLRAALGGVISKDTPVLDFPVERDFPNLGKKTMLLNARRIEDIHRNKPMMLLAIDDITEQRQAINALRESEERYRTLFDLGPIAVYSCDASGVIRDFNLRAAELWGRKPKPGETDERWCGSFKLLRPDGVFMPHEQCPMAEVLSGKVSGVHDTEVQIERPDGSRVTVIVNIRPLKNEHGEIIGAINCFVDITERKQAEKVRAQLAAIVESSDEAMISKSLDGVITSWNRGAERLFGYTAEEAIGQNITLIIPPDRLDEEATILERLKRAERVEQFETLRMRKDGTVFDISLMISPVKDSSGRVVGASKVARDITERKLAEKALQQAHDRLESMVEQRTASVRKLSLRLLTVQDEEHRSISRELHDSVGQHLVGIKMSVDWLLQQEASNKQTETLSQVSEDLDKCMGEIRTISYLLHPPMIDEIGFPAAAKWYVEGFSERSGIKVNLESSNESQRLPRSIELPLFRILQASLSNVHRHAHSPSVDVRFAINAGEAKLEVKDYGKGIDPELLGHFNRSGGGAGIGLTGMRERLRELGGRLEVESDTNGTLIRAVIPVSASTEANQSGSAA